jgi:hypothetical protein
MLLVVEKNRLLSLKRVRNSLCNLGEEQREREKNCV